MQIRELKVRNFRGIASLQWKPNQSFCCLIGAGDSGKSTILDAAEAALNSRWFTFTESDFLHCDSANAIEIEATVGELSGSLISDNRFGFYIRGWTPAGDLREEPLDSDEPVLTIRLTVDATLEPVWELVCDRTEEARTLSNRDRALFGVVRLAGEDARHLAWGQGSVLARLTGDSSEASAKLADAYRAARDSADLTGIQSLADAAGLAEASAKGLGAYVEKTYQPGLDLGKYGLSASAIALHDGEVPLRLAGLGTRRLVTLAIQKSAIAEGAIILIDEIEHGLEPHRIMGAISQLKADQAAARAARLPVGQILMTTHSDVALGESGSEGLRVVQTSRQNRIATIKSPSFPDPLKGLMRHTPRALFARRILVCEGMTEVGMLLGFREYWPPRHNGKPIEQLGVAITDGNGSQAPTMALALADLGYEIALYRDSDVPLPPTTISALVAANVRIFEYGLMLHSEQAIIFPAPNPTIQKLLAYMRSERGVDSVNDNLSVKIPGLTRAIAQADFSQWPASTGKTSAELKGLIAGVFTEKGWIKDQRISRGLASILYDVWCADHQCPLTKTLLDLETWLYA